MPFFLINNSIYKSLQLLFLFVVVVTHASNNNNSKRRLALATTKQTIKEVFKSYITRKLKTGNPGGDIVCTSPGTNPKSPQCFNQVGEQNCVTKAEAMKRWKAMPEPTQIQIYRQSGLIHRRHLGNIPFPEKFWSARRNNKLCPQPCNCWLAAPPSVDGNSRVQVWRKEGTAGWNEIKAQLTKWQVPKELFTEYEMATMIEKATFVNFDFYVQPKENSAEYEVALGTARMNGGVTEIGYLYAGKAKGILSPEYACGTAKKKKGGFFGKGGRVSYCNKQMVTNDKIKRIKSALEYFAFESIKFDASSNFDTMMNLDKNSNSQSSKSFMTDNDGLWKLDDYTKAMIGEDDGNSGGDDPLNLVYPGRIKLGSGKGNGNPLFGRPSNGGGCHRQQFRWSNDASAAAERCPFDYPPGKSFVAKINHEDLN